MTVFAPSSAQELQVMLHDALELDGPSVVRYPRGAARQVPDDQVGSGLHARLVRRGAESEVCLLAVGKLVAAAEAAATELEASGVDCTVWDVRVVKPLDPAMIADAARHPLVVTVEDGVREGGAGSLIADTLATHCAGPDIPRVEVLGTPIRFLPHGKPDRILADLGLDGPGIAATIRAILAS
jgi:1-deoxy-D-xylulose-5-phosphate synthase